MGLNPPPFWTMFKKTAGLINRYIPYNGCNKWGLNSKSLLHQLKCRTTLIKRLISELNSAVVNHKSHIITPNPITKNGQEYRFIELHTVSVSHNTNNNNCTDLSGPVSRLLLHSKYQVQMMYYGCNLSSDVSNTENTGRPKKVPFWIFSHFEEDYVAST